jgi:hypothetical protein
MSRRNELHEKLKDFLGSDAVYFNPPTGFKIKQYPCIVYNRESSDVKFANDHPYLIFQPYSITLICKSPDEGEPWRDENSDDALYRRFIKSFDKCTHDRHFISDGLSHDVYKLWY